MSAAYWLRGDTRAVLGALADAGIVVDLVVTSPPFLNLRSYLPADDPAKALEIGSEATPGEFIDTLLDITEACGRVLAPHGSIAVELGDTYAGSGGAGGDYADGGLRDGQSRFDGSAAKARRIQAAQDRGKPDGGSWRDRQVDEELGIRAPENRWRGERPGWPTDKSLSLIPEAYRLALAYGANPFTGRPTARWRVRNTVTWVRPNPPVGRDGDKFRPATSDVVIACRTDEPGRGRYWDGDAVRTQVSSNSHGGGTWTTHGGDKASTGVIPKTIAHPAGAPLLDWWKIAGSGYEGAHYATFPPALVTPLVKAMCPERVCTVCGEPSRRIVAAEPSPYTGGETERDRQGRGRAIAEARNGERRITPVTGETHAGVARRADPVGWTDCGHGAWRPGIVLDPFAGSGTTLAVATGHGRDAIGIDLDERNVALARDRVGPLFFHETTVVELAAQLRAAPIPSEVA